MYKDVKNVLISLLGAATRLAGKTKPSTYFTLLSSAASLVKDMIESGLNRVCLEEQQFTYANFFQKDDVPNVLLIPTPRRRRLRVTTGRPSPPMRQPSQLAGGNAEPRAERRVCGPGVMIARRGRRDEKDGVAGRT